MKKIRYLVLLYMLIISADSAQQSKELAYLKEYAGGYDTEKVLSDKKIGPVLKKMMGKEYSHLIKNLSVTGPVDLISGSLVISGNAPHMGSEEMGILDINLNAGTVRAAIYSHGIITVFGGQVEKYEGYADENKYSYLPISIKDWISVVNRQLTDRAHKPANVVIK